MFGEAFTLKLLPEFVHNTQPKEHGFKNHVQGFVNSLKQNSIIGEKQSYTKRQIYVVSYGMNTGSEINGDRPSIIYKASHSTFGDDVIVIPLTSVGKQKKSDSFDVFVGKNPNNKLFQNSLARLRQIRSVSTKRVGKKLGEITSDAVKAGINN